MSRNVNLRLYRKTRKRWCKARKENKKKYILIKQ